MWEWPSTSPGRRVRPGRSITFAPVASMLAVGPAASMRSPLTRTAQPSWIASPSKTRAGRRRVVSVCANPVAARTAAKRQAFMGQLSRRMRAPAGRPTAARKGRPHEVENLVHRDFALGARRIDIRRNQALIAVVIDGLHTEAILVDRDIFEQVFVNIADENFLLPFDGRGGAHHNGVSLQVRFGSGPFPLKLGVVAGLAAGDLGNQPAFEWRSE